MNQPSPSTYTSERTVVPRPRVCDPVGTSLRDAFRRDSELPAEFGRLLRRLDCVSTARV